MLVSPQSVVLWILIGVVALSPFAVGAFDASPYAVIGFILLGFAAYATSPRGGRLSKQLSLVLLSVCFAVTLFDLAARPLLRYLFVVRPSDRYIHRWQELPLLQRYDPSVNFVGPTYGDLAAMSGRDDWRQMRQIRFVTDTYGFRNEPPNPRVAVRPLDLIILGDSFGVAAGTSQEEILASRFARDFGLSVYNLSVSREGPQQEYANLLLESNRLNTREGTCVLWLIFAGNDLDDPYYPELENPRPFRIGLLSGLAQEIRDFRSSSPVHRLLSRAGKKVVIDKKFIDGQELLFIENYAQRRGRTAEDVMRHPNFLNLKTTFDAMKRLAGERRLTVAVALVPSKEEVYSWVLDGGPPWSTSVVPSGPSGVMKGLCEQHGFRFLDLKPTLVEASRREYEKSGALLWWRDDTHWNGAGQRVAAAAVYETLLSATPR